MSNEDVQRFVNDIFHIMEDLAKLSHVEAFENRVEVVTKLVKNLQFEYFKDLKRKKEKVTGRIRKIESLKLKKKKRHLSKKQKSLCRTTLALAGK